MSQKNAKFIPLQDGQGTVFTGGVVDNSPSQFISYSKTPYARNFRVNGGGISIRPGFYQFGNDLGASDYPKGIGAYYRSNPANDKIIVRYNIDGTHKLVSIDPTLGTQTSISTAGLIASDNRMNFVGANDSLYCMNGSDLIGKLNGTTYTNPVVTLKPSFGVWFNNSMWVAGDSANPNRMYKSASNNPESYSGTGNDIFDATTPIVGLCANLQTLYVFSNSYIDMINSNSIKQIGSNLVYTSVPLESMEGAMNHNTIIAYGKNVYFLSRSGKIKQVTPNNVIYDVVELSHRTNRGITTTMQTLDTDQSTASAYALPEKQIIKWFLKSKGSTFNDLVIVYSPEFDEFMPDDHNVCYGGVNYKANNYTISQIEPKVYKDEEGQTDDNSPIQFRYDTKLLTFGDITMLKCLWQIRLFLTMNRLGKLYMNIYADGSLVDSKLIDNSMIPIIIDGIGTEPVGTYTIGIDGFTTETQYGISVVRDKGYLRVKAKTFQISFVSGELGTQLLLQNLEPMVEMLHFLTASHY